MGCDIRTLRVLKLSVFSLLLLRSSEWLLQLHFTCPLLLKWHPWIPWAPSAPSWSRAACLSLVAVIRVPRATAASSMPSASVGRWARNVTEKHRASEQDPTAVCKAVYPNPDWWDGHHAPVPASYDKCAFKAVFRICIPLVKGSCSKKLFTKHISLNSQKALSINMWILINNAYCILSVLFFFCFLKFAVTTYTCVCIVYLILLYELYLTKEHTVSNCSITRLNIFYIFLLENK